MVLQPATMQNQFGSRIANASSSPPSTVSLLTQPQPQPHHPPPHHHHQQQNSSGGFSHQPLIQTGYISIPQRDDATSIFHASSTGICSSGQFTTSEEAVVNTTASTASSSGFIEVVAANGNFFRIQISS